MKSRENLPWIALVGTLAVACSSSDSGNGREGGGTGQGAAAGHAGASPGGAGGTAGSSQGGTGQGGSSGGGAPNASRTCFDTSATTEQYHLPAPTSLAPEVTFLSDWPNQAIAGGFDGIQAMDGCRYQLDASFHTWHGGPAVRVEVDPGDNPIPTSGERAEVLTMQDGQGNDFLESSASGLQFFATSYFFPSTWDGTFLQGDGDSWSAVMQFHPSGADGYFAGIQAGRRDVAAPQTLYYSSGPTLSELGPIGLGQWVDLVFQMSFATGELHIYRRDQGQAKFAEVLAMTDTTMTSPSTTYFKQGLYRGPDVNGRTDVLWIGPSARGASFSAVEQAGFGTNDGF
jgi:hypothetical protein